MRFFSYLGLFYSVNFDWQKYTISEIIPHVSEIMTVP